MIVSLLVCEIQSRILQRLLERVLKSKSIVRFLYLHLCSLLADDSGRDLITARVCVYADRDEDRIWGRGGLRTSVVKC